MKVRQLCKAGSRKADNCKDERSVAGREVSTCGQVVQGNEHGHKQRISSGGEEGNLGGCWASPTIQRLPRPHTAYPLSSFFSTKRHFHSSMPRHLYGHVSVR